MNSQGIGNDWMRMMKSMAGALVDAVNLVITLERHAAKSAEVRIYVGTARKAMVDHCLEIGFYAFLL